MDMDWDVLYHHDSFPVDPKVQAINELAASNVLAGMMTSDALGGIAKSLGGISASIMSLTSVMDKGLSAIVNENRAARFSSEYYLLLDRMVELKEKHPEVKFVVNMEDLSNHMVKLSNDMVIVLSYCFSFSDDNLFEKFTMECESGKCNPEDWFDSFIRRADGAHSTRRKVPKSTVLSRLNLPWPCPVDLDYYEDDELFFESGGAELKIVGRSAQRLCDFSPGGHFDEYPGGYLHFCKSKELKETIARVYSTHENSVKIAKGYQKLKAWVAEQSCKYMIDYLKALYTNAVVHFLND